MTRVEAAKAQLPSQVSCLAYGLTTAARGDGRSSARPGCCLRSGILVAEPRQLFDEAACQGEAHGHQGEDHNCYFYLWYVGNAFQ